MRRRELFKILGAAAVAAPIVTLAPATEIYSKLNAFTIGDLFELEDAIFLDIDTESTTVFTTRQQQHEGFFKDVVIPLMIPL